MFRESSSRSDESKRPRYRSIYQSCAKSIVEPLPARSILQIELTPVQEKVSILAIRRKHRYGEFKSQPIN